jgi:hypothetical protein
MRSILSLAGPVEGVQNAISMFMKYLIISMFFLQYIGIGDTSVILLIV